MISLADGAIGDRLELRGDGEGNSTYFASEGRLAVDAVLGGGAGGEADMLEIDGSVGEDGTTWISVNVLDALGANVVGIPVVGVSTGNTVEGDFQLAGPLNAGFYAWDLRYDAENNVHELYSSGIGVGAYEFAAGITAAQDMWFQSTGVLLQRQADLRSVIAGMLVTPVADFTEPVEATPVARLLPGFWMRGVGAWLERDDEQNGFTLDRKQTVLGGMAGFDFGLENVGGQGDALMFGLFGGYLGSDLDFKDTNTEWSYSGPSLGVYASYLNGAFYADATVKADFLNISIDPEDLAQAADESDTDGLNIGAMIDAGYKFGAGVGAFFEPQATLALLHTSIDDVDIFGGTVEFDDETSLRGRLGLRLGYDHAASNAVVYSSDVTASVWQNFSGENGATIIDPLIPAFGVADDPAQTYGDVSLGFSATAPEGWSGFLRGNYQFADDYEAFAGNAGVRVAW
ncbi:autotransporter domain-containing protein [Nordella sp. HKS 07]|uniref:autotransporter domain-containing protein n=1 Tax=Nordella sp. HKS 07 TaxID=2712222 RepID=UPI0013E1261A|nr:autotransporter outer membrane beta-barrel domain-containing protein [Nordella sp. HKS 07]QIG47327.1 autotransporter domain-containing protein [Nordella sp. HKS 07]